MITTINYAPSYLQGVYNPIIWSVTSDEIAQPNFSYVFDVYINGTFEIRLKVKPNPSGAGMIDVSQICQSYLKNDRIPETRINTTSQNYIFEDNTNSSLHLMVKAGEEYGGIMYDGNGNANLPPAFDLWASSLGNQPNIPVHVWNSSLPFQQQQDGMSNGIPLSGGYGILPSQNITYDWGDALNNSTLAYPLSYNTLKQNVYYNDMNVLSFINWTQYPFNIDETYIAFCRIAYYDANDNLIDSVFVSADTNFGYSQKDNCYDIITTQLNAEFDILHVQCRLASLIEIINFLTNNSYVMAPSHYIEIQMFNHASGNGCLPDLPITQLSRFTMLEDCDNLYTRVRLSWLNELGGRDYMNFTAFMEKDTSTTNSNYYQETMNWSALKPVNENVTNPNFNLQTKGGDVIYNKQATTAWTLNTDWLTQDEVNLLEGLQKSSNVIAYFNDTPYNVLVPQSVRIGQTSYKTKNVKQVKLVQGEFEIFLNQVQKIN
jgi:hypothetical protein